MPGELLCKTVKHLRSNKWSLLQPWRAINIMAQSKRSHRISTSTALLGPSLSKGGGKREKKNSLHLCVQPEILRPPPTTKLKRLQSRSWDQLGAALRELWSFLLSSLDQWPMTVPPSPGRDDSSGKKFILKRPWPHTHTSTSWLTGPESSAESLEVGSTRISFLSHRRRSKTLS